MNRTRLLLLFSIAAVVAAVGVFSHQPMAAHGGGLEGDAEAMRAMHQAESGDVLSAVEWEPRATEDPARWTLSGETRLRLRDVYATVLVAGNLPKLVGIINA